MAHFRAILDMLRHAAAGSADLLLPAVCCACGCDDASEGGLCETCGAGLLSLVAAPYCMRCGQGLGAGVVPSEEGCRACSDPLPRFWRAVRLGPYKPPLSLLIKGIKYRRHALRRPLASMLAQATQAALGEEELDLVLSVPMHWRRRVFRGCDHARVLARAVARQLDLPVGHELIRVRHTPPQVHLPRTRRLENVRGAFGVSDERSIAGARVLLIDDVTTTGATANEAARTLLKAGASKVMLAVLAKSEPPVAYSKKTD